MRRGFQLRTVFRFDPRPLAFKLPSFSIGKVDGFKLNCIDLRLEITGIMVALAVTVTSVMALPWQRPAIDLGECHRHLWSRHGLPEMSRDERE